MRIKERMLVACCWRSCDFPHETKNAVGLVMRRISPLRQDLFEVEILYPEALAKECIQIKGRDLFPLLRDVIVDEPQARTPEIILTLVNRIGDLEREVSWLKEASGLQFQKS